MKYFILSIVMGFCINLSATLINIPQDYPTIQAGITASVNSDTVLVQPGIYFEYISFQGKDIVVGSLYHTTQDTSYISQTIIDGNNIDWRLISFADGETEDAKLIGFTVRNGYGYSAGEIAGGAGIYIFGSSPTIENNIIEDNDSDWYAKGGGIGIQNSSAIIRNNIIRDNDGAGYGGGIFVYQSDNVLIEGNRIYNHETHSGYGVDSGAGICVRESDNILISKNLIYDNIVDFDGCGISIENSSSTITGCTLFNNSNNIYKENLYISSNSTVNLINSVLWSNSTNYGNEIDCNGEISVSYSNIKGGFEGINNIEINPLFEDITNRDFRLTLQSPCINSGDPTSENDPDGTIADIGYVSFDMSDYGNISGIVTLTPGLGNMDDVLVSIDSYIVTPFPDGEYVFNLLPGFYDVTASLSTQCEQTINNVQVIHNENTANIDFYLENTDTNTTIEIKQDGTGDFTEIQAGINAAISGDTILVYPGIYYENIRISEESISLGSLFFTTEDTTFISETVIDGNNNESVMTIENIADTTCIIVGFTIRNGNAENNGGGIHCYYSSPIISNCTITENYSDNEGGGIYCFFSNPVIENNEISNNSTLRYGGGIYSEESNPVLVDNYIHNNIATHVGSKGGGMFFRESSPTIINNRIAYNTAVSGGGISFLYNDYLLMMNNTVKNNTATIGGGLHFHGQTSGTMMNNLFTENYANYSGGAISSNNTHYNLINNTVSNNSAETGGGGLSFSGFSHSNIINTIIYGNEAETGNQIYLNSGNSDPSFYYSDIEDGLNDFGYSGLSSPDEYDGEYQNNILLNPVFTDASSGDFHLLENSPCINAGTPDTTGLNLPEYDLDYNPRIYDNRIDIGCYEWLPVSSQEENIPYSIESIQLSNYPNPFNPSTTISFSLTTEYTESTKVHIYNIKGQEVEVLSFDSNAEFYKTPRIQRHQDDSVVWDASKFASGVYFYKLNIADSPVKKMLLMK
jgi:hypothetical protein